MELPQPASDLPPLPAITPILPLGLEFELDRISQNNLPKKPAISVIGLGYVGTVSIACLANLGFEMFGVDVSLEKIKAVRSGKAPITEKGLEDLLRSGCSRYLIRTMRSIDRAVQASDITFISVGTPTAADGGCNVRAIKTVATEIGRAIAKKPGYHLVVLRCSVPPGTTRETIIPTIEAVSGKTAGEDFGVCFNPEFLREGVAVSDFYDPPKTVIGATDRRAADMLAGVFRAIDDNIIFTSIEAAEMVKYVDNVWHATKVTFANEIGRICKPLGIDSHQVMDIFVQDNKLNLSSYYLKPGFAFGGSCLPKEVRAVEFLAHKHNVCTPLLSSLLPSNVGQVEQALHLIEPHKGKKVGFLGVTFKPGTDDMRESPTLDLMAQWLDAGEDLVAFDENIRFGHELSDQRAYVRYANPRLAALMDHLETVIVDDLDDLLSTCDVLVVSHSTAAFRKAVRKRRPGTRVIDLARLSPSVPDDPTYEGIGW